MSAYKDKSAFKCGNQSNNQHRNRNIVTILVEGCEDFKMMCINIMHGQVGGILPKEFWKLIEMIKM